MLAWSYSRSPSSYPSLGHSYQGFPAANNRVSLLPWIFSMARAFLHVYGGLIRSKKPGLSDDRLSLHWFRPAHDCRYSCSKFGGYYLGYEVRSSPKRSFTSMWRSKSFPFAVSVMVRNGSLLRVPVSISQVSTQRGLLSKVQFDLANSLRLFLDFVINRYSFQRR